MCDREVWRVGLCAPHYGRFRRGGDINTPIRRKREAPDIMVRDSEGAKQCAKCYLWLAVSEFYKASKFADGLRTSCKHCDRFIVMLRKYGLSKEDYLALEAQQNYSCAICGVSGETYGNNWAIDHDHTCCSGEKSCGTCVRGLLCINCNVGLGNFKDSALLLSKATTYLETYTHG